MPEDKLKLLYDDVSKEYEVGTIDEFKTYLSDSKKRKAFFDEIVVPNYEVSSLDEFENIYGLKKKEPTPSDSPSFVGPLQPSSQTPKNKVLDILNAPTEADKIRQQAGVNPKVNATEQPSGTAKPNQNIPLADNQAKVKQDIKKVEDTRNKVADINVRETAAAQGQTPTEYFDANTDLFKPYLGSEEQVQEYELAKGVSQLENEVKQLEERAKTTGPLAQNQMDPTLAINTKKFELYKAKQQQAKFVANRTQRLNTEIEAKKQELKQREELAARTLDEDHKADAENIRKEIKALEGQRDGYFKDPNAQILKIYSDNKQDMDEFQVPGNTPLERTKNYALILKRQIDDIEWEMMERIPEIDPQAVLGQDILNPKVMNDGQYRILMDRRIQLANKLKQVAPIALLNQTQKIGTDGFFNSAVNAIAKELLPTSVIEGIGGNLKNSDIGEIIQANQVAMSLSPELITEGALIATEEATKPTEAFSPAWWGDLSGTSLSMIAAFFLANKVTAAAKIPMAFEKIALAMNATKYGRYISPVLKSIEKGIEYSAAKPFLSENLADEASFMSGFLGQAISGPMGKAISSIPMQSMFTKLFGDKAPMIYGLVKKLGDKVSGGLGEYGEEVGNTLGPIVETYIAGQDFGQLKKDLEENFGTMDKNVELFVGSFVMGMAMGLGTGLGDASLNKIREYYASLNPKQKKQADAIAKAFTDDVKKAEVEAKKEEIKEGVAPIVEEISDVDLQELESAKETIKSPNTTNAEKVEAGKKIAEIQEKQRNQEITELAIEEGIKEGEVKVEEVTPTEEATTDESDIKRRRDKDKKQVMLDFKGSVNESDSYFALVTDNNNEVVTLRGQTKDEVVSKVDEFYDDQLKNLKKAPTEEVVENIDEEVVENLDLPTIFKDEQEIEKHEREVQSKLDDYFDEVEKELGSFEKANDSINLSAPFNKKLNLPYNDKHKYYWDLLDERDRLVNDNERLLKDTIDNSLSSVDGISKDLKNNIIENYFKLTNQQGKPVMFNVANPNSANSIQNTLSNDSLPKLANFIAEERATEMGLDFDLLFSPMSGWSKNQQDKFLEENAKIAKNIQENILKEVASKYEQTTLSNEQSTPIKEQSQEVVSEEVKQETPTKEDVKEQKGELNDVESTAKNEVKIKYGGKDKDLKGNPKKQWMLPKETSEEATQRLSDFVEASDYKGREQSTFIDRNGESVEVKLRNDDGKWNWYESKSKKPFASFGSAKEAIKFIQEQPFWNNGELNKKGRNDAYFAKVKADSIKTELENGNILDDISDGKISAEEAKSIIESAGLKVPKEIESLLSKQQPQDQKSETPTKEVVKEQEESVLNSKTDLLGDEKKSFMQTLSDYENTYNGKDNLKAKLQFKAGTQRAIDDGMYQKAVKEGRMTANDAKTIIEEAGLKVPKEIESLLSKEQTPTALRDVESTAKLKLDPDLAKIDQTLIDARNGDKEAQRLYEEMGLDWEQTTTYRFVGQSEVDVLLANEKVESKRGMADNGIDVTSSPKVTTAANNEHRVTFKESFDKNNGLGKVRKKNETDSNLERGRGYDINDVAKIESLDENGNVVEVIYDSESLLSKEQTQEVKSEIPTPLKVKSGDKVKTLSKDNKVISAEVVRQKGDSVTLKLSDGSTTVRNKADLFKTKADAEAFAQSKKPKVEIPPSSFTTKSGNQVVYRNEQGLVEVMDVKTGKEPSSKTVKKAINEYADTLDFTKGDVAPPIDENLRGDVSPEDVDKIIAETSNNPAEVVRVFVQQPLIPKVDKNKISKSANNSWFIAEFGLGRVKRQSFVDFNDESNVNMVMAKTYFSKDGLPLDQRALEMSDYFGVEITPEELAQFMIDYPNGSQDYYKEQENDAAYSARERFRELTGLEITDSIIEKVKEQEKEKLKKEEQLIIQKEYETYEQLREEYWENYEQINGSTESIGSEKAIEPISKGKGEGVPSVESLKEKVAKAEKELKTAQSKLSKAKESQKEIGKEQQLDILGNKPADNKLFGADISIVEKQIKKLQDDVDDAKDNLDKAKAELNKGVAPENQVQMDLDVSNEKDGTEGKGEEVINPALANVEATAKALDGKEKNIKGIKKFFNTVYHATKGKFKDFSENFLGSNTKAKSAQEGFFFASNKDVSVSYASKANDVYEKLQKEMKESLSLMQEKIGMSLFDYNHTISKYYRFTPEELVKIEANKELIEKTQKSYNTFVEYKLSYDFEPAWTPNELSEEGELKEVVLDIKNPFIYDQKGEPYRDKTFVDVIKEAKEKGHDGVIIKNTYDGNNPFTREMPTDVHIVFKPSQIKDANQAISEAYHKAKADGSNPELVKAVEDLLSEQPTNQKEVKSPREKSQEKLLVEASQTNLNQPNYIEQVKSMSKKDFVEKMADKFGGDKAKAEAYYNDIKNGIFVAESTKLKEDLAKELNRMRGDLGSFKFISTEFATKAAKLMGLYYKQGVTKFKDFLTATGLASSQFLRDLWAKVTRKSTSTIGKSAKNAKLKNLNARLFYTEALLGVDPQADAQVQLDAIKDTIGVFDIMSIHANENDVNDIINARDAMASLYVELSNDLRLVGERIAEEIANGQKAIELKKQLSYKDSLLQMFADDAVELRNVQRLIEKERGLIADENNPYMQRDIGIGKTQDIIDRMEKYLYGKQFGKMATNKTSKKGGEKPFFERLKKDGVKESDFSLYLYAIHAPQFNERVRVMKEIEKNEKIDKLTKDISELVKQNNPSNQAEINRLNQELAAEQAVEIPQSGSGMTNKEAQELLDELGKKGLIPTLEKYEKEFRENVINKSIELMESSGKINPTTAQMLRDGIDEKTGVKFDHYVPLKVNQGMFADAIGNYDNGGIGNPFKRIKGSDKYDYAKRNSPVAQAILDFRAAARAAQDNKIKQSLYNLVKQNPQKDIWELVKEEYNTPDSVKSRSVAVEINGARMLIVFNHEGLKYIWQNSNAQQIERALKVLTLALRTIMSLKRNLLTTLSIEFGLVNPFRDVQDALFNATGLNMPGIEKKMAKNVLPATAASFKAIFGNLDPDSKWGKHIDGFLSHGSKISWLDYSLIEDEQSKIRDMQSKGISPETIAKKAAKSVLTSIEAFNDAMESGTRVAVYATLVENGVSPDKAALISKNLTVNFNKKGTRTPITNLLWLFSKAGTVGIYNSLNAFRYTRRTKVLSAMILSAGVMLPLLRNWMIDMLEDDEEEKQKLRDEITSKDTRNNIVLYVGKGRLATYPLSFGGPKILLNTGQEIGDMIQDGKTAEHAAEIAWHSFSFLDPVGGSKENKKSAYAFTVTQPIIELWINKDWRNNTIYPEYIDENLPYYQQYKKGTPQKYINFSETLYNNLNINWMPNKMEYFVNDWTGGIVKTISNIGDITSDAFNDRPINQNQIPFFRRFVVNMNQQEWRQSSFVWETVELSKNAILPKEQIERAIKYATEMGFDSERIEKITQDISNNQLDLKIFKEVGVDYKKTPLTPDQRKKVIAIINQHKDQKRADYVIKKMAEVILKEKGTTNVEEKELDEPTEFEPKTIDDLNNLINP